MSKQEDILGGVTELIRLAILNKDLPVRPAKEVLEYLHDNDVVIKMAREYPDAEGCLRPSDYMNRLHRAGYVAVEPLIERSKI